MVIRASCATINPAARILDNSSTLDEDSSSSIGNAILAQNNFGSRQCPVVLTLCGLQQAHKLI